MRSTRFVKFTATSYPGRIPGSTGTRVVFINPDAVHVVTSDRSGCWLVVGELEYRVDATLSEVLAALTGEQEGS